jgi:cellulose synthase/poly-beta-1,6-N-acetylglucosamine synthase-like glycosyltransferase
MLGGTLIAALVAAVLVTAGLFTPVPQRLGGGALLWTRRLTLAVVGTLVVSAAGAAAAGIAGNSLRQVETIFVVLSAGSLLWLPYTRRWNARAHLCWAMNVTLFVVYLAFMWEWTLASPLGLGGQVGAFLLLALEAFAALLGCAYLWELCDVLGREHWLRRSGAGLIGKSAEGLRHPFVSLHVPAHEEPPEMVIATLESLRGLDYPEYEIVVIDDNTEDEALWRPVEAWCAEHDVKFAHLDDWPGYKSGALNYALRAMTDPRAEVIGIIDSDYQIQPDFLASCAPLFDDPRVGFVQTPQDYRGWQRTPFFRRLYRSYQYFFAVSQPSRNERDGAIFAGTMGLIRREALDELGGWDEWCITEDAELSLRLLRAGWSGRHVDASFGHGLMPLSFEALKGQRFRWCFGGIQILRMHWRSMVPGLAGRKNRLTNGQRWAYLSGALQWYGDLLSLIFFFFLLGGAVNIALGGGLLFRMLTPFLLGAIPVLMLVGFIRAVALIRHGTGASWSDALGAFFIWQATSLVVARASVQALFAKKAEFLRTPKTSDHASVLDALRGNRAETVLGLAGTAGIVAALLHPTSLSGPLLAGLLLLPTAAFLSAPINSLAARRTPLPADLAARRRSELRTGQFARRTALAGTAGLGMAAATAAVVLALMGPHGAEVTAPNLRPHPGHPSTQRSPQGPRPGRAAPTPGASHTGGTSALTGSSPSSSPSSRPTRSPSPTTASPTPTAPTSTAAAPTTPQSTPTTQPPSPTTTSSPGTSTPGAATP